MCRHTSVIKSGHTILGQGTLCLYSILGWMHKRKILKAIHHEQQLDIGLGPACRERGCACPHVWHPLGFAYLMVAIGKTKSDADCMYSIYDCIVSVC